MKVKKKHFGFLTIFVVGVGIIAAVIMIRNGFSARDNPSALETLAAKTMRRLSVPSRAKNMKNPVPVSAEVLANAKAHWADHCAFCHANNGSGNTDVGRNLYPKAPDMRLPATQDLTDGELYYTIKNGIRLTGMPAWGDPTDEDMDSWKLVYFIRHLPSLTPAEEREMERLNPKAPDELLEEQQEEEFLRGEPPTQQKPKAMQHSKH